MGTTASAKTGQLSVKEKQVATADAKQPVMGQYSGAIVGSCVGDAVGLLVEGSSVPVCRDFAHQLKVLCSHGKNSSHPNSSQAKASGSGVALVEMITQKSIVHEPLQYSDDSQLAREMMISIVEVGVYELTNFVLMVFLGLRSFPLL